MTTRLLQFLDKILFKIQYILWKINSNTLFPVFESIDKTRVKLNNYLYPNLPF